MAVTINVNPPRLVSSNRSTDDNEGIGNDGRERLKSRGPKRVKGRNMWNRSGRRTLTKGVDGT